MTQHKLTSSDFLKFLFGVFLFAVLILATTIIVNNLLPSDTRNLTSDKSETEKSRVEPTLFPQAITDHAKKQDAGLYLYRNENTRETVTWFYSHITGDTEITTAILEYAEKNDIPPALAFALAYAESRYKPDAINKNVNGSIDRGVFQLNNRSFPKLAEEDFFNPRTSAKYGLSHLRFCLDTAGNEVSALAMYNAGTGKVKKDNTPKRTLDYVSCILSYRNGVDELFRSEVIAKVPPTEMSVQLASLK